MSTSIDWLLFLKMYLFHSYSAQDEGNNLLSCLLAKQPSNNAKSL